MRETENAAAPFPVWTPTFPTPALSEADRIMTICNSCRYCEGLCAVFPAMEKKIFFDAAYLRFLSNLCHGCGACYDACQFSPPHEFSVNVPKTFDTLRTESYADYVWPPVLAGVFKRNGAAIATTTALAVAAFILGFVYVNDPTVVFSSQTGPGAFYRLMPHTVMALLFGAAFLYACVALVMGVRSFWKDIAGPNHRFWSGVLPAIRDALSLRYLGGGGGGCAEGSTAKPDRRRLFHHFTFYGFLLCFASTCVATLYHYVLGLEAPYPWYTPPVLLGIVGGIGLIVGPIGLLAHKKRRDEDLHAGSHRGMEVAFLWMLLTTSLTGQLLLVLRATPAMGVLLALHLGVVFSLFITMPYGKFVHGFYRFTALVRYAIKE